ncbi:hypothetical protein MJT46_012013 [Ovis ammon polii x Ovis aries]|nr:hypothetical protein MJT46_012013 [Ovis ammon polii x Ovis aries]
MKTSVKMYLWLPRRKQLRLHSDITITITVSIPIPTPTPIPILIPTPTPIMGISFMKMLIFQSLQNQTHQIPLRIPLLQVFITTTIGTRVTKDRVTQITVIHQ